MNTVFVIIEDEYEPFQLVCGVVQELFPNDTVKIIPEPNEDNFLEFKKTYLRFLVKPDNPVYVEEFKKFIGEDPQFFIIDFSLLDQINKIDSYGGVIRQRFVKRFYPKSHVIFFSKYSRSYIEPYMEYNDDFFSKLSFNYNDKVKKYWKDNLAYFTQK